MDKYQKKQYIQEYFLGNLGAELFKNAESMHKNLQQVSVDLGWKFEFPNGELVTEQDLESFFE